MAIAQSNSPITGSAEAAAKAAGSAARRRRVWKDRHYKWVPNGTGGWKKQSYIKTHRRRPRRNHPRGPGPKPSRPSYVKPTAPPPPTKPVTPPPPGAYQGTFGPVQAKRLLDRAGFGPAPGQAAQL